MQQRHVQNKRLPFEMACGWNEGRAFDFPALGLSLRFTTHCCTAALLLCSLPLHQYFPTYSMISFPHTSSGISFMAILVRCNHQSSSFRNVDQTNTTVTRVDTTYLSPASRISYPQMIPPRLQPYYAMSPS